MHLAGFPSGTSGKEPTCQCRRYKRHGFDPWVGKMLWRRKWQPIPGFLPGKIPWTEELGRLQSMGSPRVGHGCMTECTHTQTHTCKEWGGGHWLAADKKLNCSDSHTCEVRAEFLRSCSPAHTLRSAGESPRARGLTLPSLAWMHHPQKQWDNKHILSHKFWGNLFQWAK